mmetsp:Transcript_9523/g.20764  ORF Transcript_9523/g.20764 Transcript_9523/m.20764 type:complete len:216 (+) Transcript_9523:1811-2458(+)
MLRLRLVSSRGLSTSICPYKILDVLSSASQADIRAKYLQLARQHHPDVQPNCSPGFFEQVNSAYQRLSDPKKRAEHDASRASADETVATARALSDRGHLGEALNLFFGFTDCQAPSISKRALASTLFTACTARGGAAYAAPFQRTALLWQWLLEHSQVDAQACNAWFAMCISLGHYPEAMAAHRHAVQHNLQQSRHMQMTLRQIKHYKETQRRSL